MARLPIDLASANLIPAGEYIGTINRLDYQIKTGEKWNKDGTSTVSAEEFDAHADFEKKRLHYTIAIPGKGNIFHDLYLMERALGFVKSFMKAAGVAYDKTGFDPEEAVSKQIGLSITISENDNGEQNNVSVYKA